MYFFLFFEFCIEIFYFNISRLLVTTTNKLKESNSANIALKEELNSAKAALKASEEALEKSEIEMIEKDKKFAKLSKYGGSILKEMTFFSYLFVGILKLSILYLVSSLTDWLRPSVRSIKLKDY